MDLRDKTTFDLLLFTFNLTMAFVIFVLNRNGTDRLQGDRIIGAFLLFLIGDLVFQTGGIVLFGSEAGWIQIMGLLFGFIYGPLLSLIFFRPNEKPDLRQILLHGLPFLISSSGTILVFALFGGEHVQRQVFLVLSCGVLISWVIYFAEGVWYFRKKKPVHIPGNRNVILFWGICLVILGGFWVMELFFSRPLMRTGMGILFAGLMFRLYRYYFQRGYRSVSTEVLTFSFDSTILDQIRYGPEEEMIMVQVDERDPEAPISENIEFLDPDLSLSSLVEKTGFSVSFLENKIREETGLTFKNFVNEKRIAHALVLLEERPDLPVNEVMSGSAYKSRATFYRNFKAYTGMTPKEYLSKLQNPKA